MKLRFFFLLIFFFCISSSFAQEDDYKAAPDTGNYNNYADNNFFKRFYLGGNFGAAFGTVSYVQLAPLIGYKATKNLSLGGGVEYFYYGNASFNSNFYGGCIFTRYRFIEQAFAHVEYKVLNIKYYDWNSAGYNRTWIDALLVGGGYSQKISGNLYSQIFLLFNVIPHPLYPFSNPIINIGVNYGF
ncbi:MAG: hypothetical protein D6707_12805 [Bacteroidetes bacterium]|nr:MAG: hypothetical protein D6707_12805 [Bacteroidota bacterium]